MTTFDEIRAILQDHHDLFANAIPLIASENVTSPACREACLSDLQHRYAEGWVGQRVYAGCEYLDKIEAMCMELARDYFRCKFADVRPVSGVVANLAMFNAFTTPKGKMCAMSIPSGGHISHAPHFAKSGREIFGTAGTVRGLQIEYLKLDWEEMNLDVDASAKVIREFEPELLLFGASVILFPQPVKELSAVAKEVGARVGYDAAHVAGLIGSGYFQDPLAEGAEVMTCSTHKTLPGPQHGALLSNADDDTIEYLKSCSFPALLSNHHLHNVAGLAVTLAEMKAHGKAYHGQVIKNAKRFAEALHERGFNVLMEHKGFTESHQVLVEVANFEKTVGLGGDIERLLEQAGIIVNRNLLPWDISKYHRNYMNPGGLRLGTSEVTRLGMKESEMDQVAEFMKQVVVDQKDPKQVKGDVATFMKDFTTVQYAFPSKTTAYEYLKIA